VREMEHDNLRRGRNSHRPARPDHDRFRNRKQSVAPPTEPRLATISTLGNGRRINFNDLLEFGKSCIRIAVKFQ
jgi:hypothetical protein